MRAWRANITNFPRPICHQVAAAPSQDPPLLPIVPGQVAEKAEKMSESSPQSVNRDGNKSVRFLVNQKKTWRKRDFGK